MKIYIYSFINKINGHRYIGKTNNFERRIREHKSMSMNPKIINTEHDYLWYQKIREYGFDNFDFEIVEVTNEERWQERERYWISYYNTYNGPGYNTTPGGDGSENLRLLTDEEVNELINDLLNSSLTQEEIAVKFDVSSALVSNINQGSRYRVDNINYPIRKNYKTGLEEYGELIHLLQHSYYSFREIAQKLNMCESSVKKINYGKMQYDSNFNYPIRKYDTRSVKLIQKELMYSPLTINELSIKHKISIKQLEKINNGEILFNSILKYPLRK